MNDEFISPLLKKENEALVMHVERFFDILELKHNKETSTFCRVICTTNGDNKFYLTAVLNASALRQVDGFGAGTFIKLAEFLSKVGWEAVYSRIGNEPW